ncbi:hypothetical protein HYH03_013454 [Edaphochlamys debaryana]|uniref:Uncharacterized protein n=1 Tax=Edaphochlamys debaryana TaxID=47281 RepID=A0A836BUK5_9CHLO|nr:hypothetical protein HYH03_013454 [Edaphochlamys debaryana]|eukprot:KAG2488019.1 hypothetical protein HYH03_013454 [Edaphochlamys debaryana]
MSQPPPCSAPTAPHPRGPLSFSRSLRICCRLLLALCAACALVQCVLRDDEAGSALCCAARAARDRRHAGRWAEAAGRGLAVLALRRARDDAAAAHDYDYAQQLQVVPWGGWDSILLVQRLDGWKLASEAARDYAGARAPWEAAQRLRAACGGGPAGHPQAQAHARAAAWLHPLELTAFAQRCGAALQAHA